MPLTLGFTPCFSAGGPRGGGWTRICLNRVPSGPVYTSGLEEHCPLPSSLPSPDHPRAPLPKAPHCPPPPTEGDVQGEWPAWGTYAKNHSSLNSYSGGGFEICSFLPFLWVLGELLCSQGPCEPHICAHVLCPGPTQSPPAHSRGNSAERGRGRRRQATEWELAESGPIPEHTCLAPPIPHCLPLPS